MKNKVVAIVIAIVPWAVVPCAVKLTGVPVPRSVSLSLSFSLSSVRPRRVKDGQRYSLLATVVLIFVTSLRYYSYTSIMPKPKVKEHRAAIVWKSKNEKINKKGEAFCDIVDLTCVPKKYRTEGWLYCVSEVDGQIDGYKTSFHKAEVLKVSSTVKILRPRWNLQSR